MNRRTIFFTGTVTAVYYLSVKSAFSGTKEKAVETKQPKIVKTDKEWKEQLTEEQFRVTRKAGTERPFGKAYEEFKKQGEGTYYCVCCDKELFSSSEKFNSGCGWPSFYDPSKPHNVVEKRDVSHGMERVEVLCAHCDAHLGHVFTGEGFSTPTDKRYCINMAALRFVEPGGEDEKKTAEEKAEKDDTVSEEKEKETKTASKD